MALSPAVVLLQTLLALLRSPIAVESLMVCTTAEAAAFLEDEERALLLLLLLLLESSGLQAVPCAVARPPALCARRRHAAFW